MFGLLALLTIAGATAVIGGRVDRGVAVPAAVLDLQQAAAVAAAQQVRNGMQAGLKDLGQLADGLAVTADAAVFDAQVKAFARRHGRYRSVYALDGARRVIAGTGLEPHPSHVPAGPDRAGMTDAVDIDHVAVVVLYVPFVRSDGGHATAVAEYDLARLRYALQTVKPSTAWVVNANGEVIASTVGFVAFEQLARGQLRGAAAAAHDKPGVSVTQEGIDAGEIVAFAPIRGGDTHSTVPRWALVTARNINAVVLPQTQARDQALLLALALTVVTVGVFAWLYVLWLRPMRRLVHDADRVAHGDLTAAVQVRRHDEIGLVAAAIERIRMGLIRDHLSRRRPDHTQTQRTVPREVD